MRPGIGHIVVAALAMVTWWAVSPQVSSQVPAPTTAPQYSAAQLDQLLAPIALYPDGLLGQILMASTYPLEVAEAARWVQEPANALLRNDALARAVEPIDWDPSVKALVPFPSVLLMMSSQLGWMQTLGDAFLAQQADVMNSVQRLRRQAMNAGTLVSTPQQTVTVVDGWIYIEPATADVLYVPAYDPGVVYGPWPYPAYPPYFFLPPPGYGYGPLSVGIVFGVGFYIVHTFWGWDRFDWLHHRIYIDAPRVNVINRYFIEHFHRPAFEGREWRYNLRHRVGVPYRSPQVRERYERRQPGTPQSRYEYRGYPQSPPASRPQPALVPPRRVLPGRAERPAPPVRVRPAPPLIERPAAPIYQRSRSGAEAHEFSSRGRQSRQSIPRQTEPQRGRSQREGRSRGDQSPRQ